MKSLKKIKNLKNGKVLAKMSRMKVCVIVSVGDCVCVCVDALMILCKCVCFPIKVGRKNLRLEEKIALELNLISNNVNYKTD